MAAKQSVADRARHDRAFLKKALANPGLRSKLPASMLPANLRQQRETNARLAQPIVPGSSMTEGTLAQAAQAATAVKYGPSERELGQQLGVAQQTQQDTGSFYNQYLADLAQHAQNVAAFQQGAQQALQQTAAGITGLSGAEGAALQQQANATAVPGVATAGNLAPMASDATAIRQALIGSFQAQQALQGANANTYADTQARVVGPGQKLTAQAQAAGRTRDVGKQIQALRDEEGAYNQSFRDTRRQDEFKNVLAQQTLTGNQAIAATNAATSAAKNDPATAASVAGAKSAASTAAKYGYTAHQWALLGPKGRADVIAKAKKSSARGSDTVYSSGPFAGRSKSEVAAMSDSERQKLVNDFNNGKKKPPDPATQDAKDFQRKYGVKPVGTVQINNANNAIQQAALWIHRVKQSNPGMSLGQIGQLLTTGQPKSKDSTAIPKQNALFVRVAMDLYQYGGVRPGTADRLHHAGYSVAKLRLKSSRPSAGQAIPGVGAVPANG